MWFPFQSIVNQFIGIMTCYALFMGLYYGNIWNAKDFPFVSQELFSTTSNSTNYVIYKQSQILDSKFHIDHDQLDQVILLSLTSAYIGYLITSNVGFTAAFPICSSGTTTT